MKTYLKKLIGLTALGMSLLLNTAPTWAGLDSNLEVIVNTNGLQWASGGMVDARYSKDSNQMIGCKAYTFQTYSWTSCFASDKAGKSLFCGSGDPRWAEVVQGMTDSSQIYFQLVNANGGDCGFISIKNFSHQLK